MFKKTTHLITIASALALVAVTITASGAMAAKSHPNGPATGPQNILVFTRDGKVVGETKPPCIGNVAGAVMCANDLHFYWVTPKDCKGGYEVPPVFVLWTSFGRLVWLNQPLTQAPCRANDFEFGWDANNFVTTASWTYNGKIIKRIPLGGPATANQPINDAHIYWGNPGRLLKAYWSFDGKLYGKPIPVPPGTNDAHWISPTS